MTFKVGDKVRVLTQEGIINTYFNEIDTPKTVVDIYDNYIEVGCPELTQRVHPDDIEPWFEPEEDIWFAEELEAMLDVEDYIETMTFVSENNVGDMSMRTLSSDAITLTEVANAIGDFLRGAGYSYVTGVEIHTGIGSTKSDW